MKVTGLSSSCLTDAGVARSRPASTSFIAFALDKPEPFPLLPPMLPPPPIRFPRSLLTMLLLLLLLLLLLSFSSCSSSSPLHSSSSLARCSLARVRALALALSSSRSCSLTLSLSRARALAFSSLAFALSPLARLSLSLQRKASYRERKGREIKRHLFAANQRRHRLLSHHTQTHYV